MCTCVRCFRTYIFIAKLEAPTSHTLSIAPLWRWAHPSQTHAGATATLSSWVRHPVTSRKHCPHPPQPLTFTFCHLHIYNISPVLVPELWGREYNTDIPFRVEYSSVFCSVLWLAVFLFNCCPLHTLLRWGLRAALICECRDTDLEVSLILYPFSKIIVIGSSLGAVCSPARAFEWIEGQVWIAPCGAGL